MEYLSVRGVGSYLKLGGQVVMWGAQSVPSGKVGLTDLPKPGWEIAQSAHPSPTPLLSYSRWIAGDEIGSHNMSEKKKNSPPRAADKHVVWLAP